MEQQIPQLDQQSQLKEDRKVQAENMRLKKRIYELEDEIAILKSFLGV